jgi:methyl-accepting chemotaxis protein
MGGFKNLRMFVKLMLGFLAVVAILAGISIFAVSQLEKVNQTSTDMEAIWMPLARHVAEMNTAQADFRRAELQHVLSTEDKEMDNYEKRMEKATARLESAAKEYEKVVASAEERKIYGDIRDAWKGYLQEHAKIRVFSRANQNDQARDATRGESAKAYARMQEGMEKLTELATQGGKEASHRGDEMYAHARSMLVGASVSGAVLAMLIAWALAQAVTGPLRKCMSFAGAMAVGDLTHTLDIDQKDEIGQMVKALNQVGDAERTISGLAAKLAVGELNVDIKERSDKDELMRSLAALVTAERSVTDTAAKLALGDLDVNVAPRSSGDELLQALGRLIAAEENVAGISERLAEGDLTVSVTPRSDKDRLMRSLAAMVQALTGVVTETQVGPSRSRRAARSFRPPPSPCPRGPRNRLPAWRRSPPPWRR